MVADGTGHSTLNQDREQTQDNAKPFIRLQKEIVRADMSHMTVGHARTGNCWSGSMGAELRFAKRSVLRRKDAVHTASEGRSD